MTKHYFLKNFLFDYDNTIINCDTDFLWNKFLFKLGIFNYCYYKLNNFFFYLYNIKKLNDKCYLKNILNINIKFLKLVEIYNYILKIFYNNLNYISKIITTSTNNFILKNFKNKKNTFIYSSSINYSNYNVNKIINIKKKLNKKIIFTDSYNDLSIIYYVKKKCFINCDMILYLIFKKKKKNFNIIYK